MRRTIGRLTISSAVFIAIISNFFSLAQATTAPDLVVTESYIAATDREYRHLWIVNRKTRQIAATISVNDVPRGFVHDLRDLRIGVTDLLIQADPASVLGPASTGKKKKVYTLRDHFPYPVSSADYQVEPLLGWRVPGRRVRNVLKRVFLFPALSDIPFYYDLEASHLVIGPNRVTVETEKPPWTDAIPDSARGKIYVPFSRGGKSGVAIIHLEARKDESGRSIEKGAVEEFILGTLAVGERGVVSPDGSHLYLVSGETLLQVIDLRNKRLINRVRMVDALPAYRLEFKLALSPDGNELYLLEGWNLQARDAKTFEVLWKLPLRPPHY